MAQPFSTARDIASLTREEFENTCREHTWYAYLGSNLGLCKVLTKHRVYIDPTDIGISPHYITDGFWESWVTQCLARIVKPGDVCIDIGANFGYFTLLMRDLCGKEGKVIAIEPNPRIAQILRFTQSISPRFEIAEVALSNKDGSARLSIPKFSVGGATLMKNTKPWFVTQSKVKVVMRTLDRLIRDYGLSKVDVVKMDVEGLEPEVFEGMKETIANNPGIKIIIECSPFFYKDRDQFSDYLFSNFAVTRIKDVAEPTLLDEGAMKNMLRELVESKSHTDLLLTRK
jgi:FkbM family methyltransferase